MLNNESKSRMRWRFFLSFAAAIGNSIGQTNTVFHLSIILTYSTATAVLYLSAILWNFHLFYCLLLLKCLQTGATDLENPSIIDVAISAAQASMRREGRLVQIYHSLEQVMAKIQAQVELCRYAIPWSRSAKQNIAGFITAILKFSLISFNHLFKWIVCGTTEKMFIEIQFYHEN